MSIPDLNATLSPDPIVQAISGLLRDSGAQNNEWTGTATQLYEILTGAGIPDLPATPKGLTQRLHSMPLAIFGITMTHRVTNEARLLQLAATHPLFDASQEAQTCVTNSSESTTCDTSAASPLGESG